MDERFNLEKLQSMNVQQVRTYIRQLTKEANKVLYETSNESYMQELAQEIANRNNMTSKTGAFVGRLNYKRKDELISQAMDLQQFIAADKLSVTAREKEDARVKKAYEKYKQSSSIENLTIEEYKDIVHAFSAVADLIEYYGSDIAAETINNVQENVSEQIENKTEMLEELYERKANGEDVDDQIQRLENLKEITQQDVINVMRDVMRETEGEGLDAYTLQKIVYARFNLE